jgi:SAM-dependent methyltransferase
VSAVDRNDLVVKWTSEYEMGGIPSSMRTAPSGAVVWALEELKRQNFPLREAIDVGCGKGRNSLYLARQGMHVTGMDFTPSAIQHLNESAVAEGLADKIRALSYDVTEPWPLAPESADLVVDAFCFKHITPHEARDSYKQSLLRVLRTRGHYLISFASIGDGYYGRYVTRRVDEHEEVVIDPVNGIESAIFSRQRVLQFFMPELDLLTEIHHNKPSAMHGHVYDRSAYALLLRRNPRFYMGINR